MKAMCSGRHARISGGVFVDTPRLFETCRRWFEKMESPYDVNNPLFIAYRLSLFHNITDTGMRASGDDHKPFVCPERQRRIVDDMIFSGCSVRKDYFSRSRIDLLEPEIPFNLP